MTTLMEYKTLNEKALTVSGSVVERLGDNELTNLAIDIENDIALGVSRQELISRGKDNIQSRISIKKICKSIVNDLEVILKKFDCENASDKKTIKLYKNKFLNTISLLDRLQLEWQKHDLMLKY